MVVLKSSMQPRLDAKDSKLNHFHLISLNRQSVCLVNFLEGVKKSHPKRKQEFKDGETLSLHGIALHILFKGSFYLFLCCRLKSLMLVLVI